MNEESLIGELRDSRPTIDRNKAQFAELERALTLPVMDRPSPLAPLLIPVTLATLALALFLGSPKDAIGFNPLSDTTDWSTPVRASEVMPWMIVSPRQSSSSPISRADFTPLEFTIE